MARSFRLAGLRTHALRRRPAAAPVAGGRIAPAGLARGRFGRAAFGRAAFGRAPFGHAPRGRISFGAGRLTRAWLGRFAARLHLGTFGNACFLIGSVAFLSDASQRFGVWLFIAGSAALLVDGLTRGHDR